jgi:uncharacterized protein
MDETGFRAAIRANRINREILARLPSLALADSWLVSGSLFQTVRNAKAARDPGHGIKDYDVFYFDPDLSWEAEDGVIRRAADLFADLGADIELRNQARVHLWYEAKFARPYPPLIRSTEGIDRFLMHNAQVGIRADGEIYAPRRFDDIEAMIVRPNYTANFHPGRYWEKALRWKARWPELTILPA